MQRGDKLRTIERAGGLADRNNRWGAVDTGCEQVGECEESNRGKRESHGRNVLGQNRTQVGVGCLFFK